MPRSAWKSELLRFSVGWNKGFSLGGDIFSGGVDGMGDFRWIIGRDVPLPLSPARTIMALRI